MNKPTLLHNPRCSKSRQALAILEDKGIEFNTRLYLQDPLSISELKDLLTKGPTLMQITRKTEDAYKQLQNPTDKKLLEQINANPIILERPILINGDKAIVGRPPEDILTIL